MGTTDGGAEKAHYYYVGTPVDIESTTGINVRTVQQVRRLWL